MIPNNKENIFEAFRKLGWDFKNRGAGYYGFITPDKKELRLNIRFLENDSAYQLVWEFDDFRGSINFFFDDDIFLFWLSEDTISLSVKGISGVFINFSNFGKSKD